MHYFRPEPFRILSGNVPRYVENKFVRARMDFRYAGDWTVASFPSLQSPNAVEGLVKLLTSFYVGVLPGLQSPNAVGLGVYINTQRLLMSFYVGVLPGLPPH